MVKLFKPYISWRSIYYAVRVLLGTEIAEGKWVRRFEKEFSEKFHKEHVVALNSGSSALELAYELAGLKEGDEVITPVLTCTATNIPLKRRGVKIVWADVDYDLNVSVRDVYQKITPQTKAIIFVHFGGNNAGLRKLKEICEEKKIILIEDAAQAIGSNYWGVGDFTAVSLQAIKTLTSGDGGVLLVKDKELYEKAKRLRWFGYDREQKQKQGDIDLKEAGYKYHMNNITAAIGLGNLMVIDKLIEHRENLMEIYKEYGLLASIWLTTGFSNDYQALRKVYEENGIEIGQHHYRNDKYSLFGGKQKGLLQMDFIENQYFFVPMHYGVSKKVAHKIGKIYANNK